MQPCRCTHCSPGSAPMTAVMVSTQPASTAAVAPSGLRSVRPTISPSACSQLPGTPVAATACTARRPPRRMMRFLLASLLASWRMTDMAVRVTAALSACASDSASSSSTPPSSAMPWQISSVTLTRRSAEQPAAASGADPSSSARRSTASSADAAPLLQISRADLKAPLVRHGLSSSATVTLRSVVQVATSVAASAPSSRSVRSMASSPPCAMKLALLSSFLKHACAVVVYAAAGSAPAGAAPASSASIAAVPPFLWNASRCGSVTSAAVSVCRPSTTRPSSASCSFGSAPSSVLTSPFCEDTANASAVNASPRLLSASSSRTTASTSPASCPPSASSRRGMAATMGCSVRSA
mmetsp:Transcript_38304/g.97031  ORF Transcript_38304/g.97031 Transcript_38304/m.97031 type:complete len:353 (+) Transcript_38304:443-1501(+)